MENDVSRPHAAAPRRWAGTALLVIATIHTAFGVLAGLRILPDPEMQRLAGDRAPLLELTPGFGVLSEVQPLPLLMFWFLFFGFALYPLGFLVRHLERKGERVPYFVGLQLLALGIGGGIMLPASGFWTVLVPAYNILRGQRGSASKNPKPILNSRVRAS